jgi:hypothetical protein
MIIKSLLLSFLIEFLAIVAIIALTHNQSETCFALLFYTVFMWPVVWVSVMIWPAKNVQIDMIKMQNFYNLAAIRQNSDRETNHYHGQTK